MGILSNDLYITKSDFGGSPNTYKNKALNQRFRLLQDGDFLLEPGVEWLQLQTGGFEITIPNWEIGEDTVIVVQFY